MSEWDDIIQRVVETFGIIERRRWPEVLQEAVGVLAERHECTPDEMARRIRQSSAALRELAGWLTIDESYFFRHRDDFDFLQQYLRAAGQGPGRDLNLWSAGCAKGEEPYSMAITVLENQGFFPGKVSISANDINKKALEHAERGVYEAWSFRDCPDWLQERYFVRSGKRSHRLNPRAQSLVQFLHLSVEECCQRFGLGSMDVVFFRNVSIYLDPGHLERLYQGIHRVLTEDGFLVVGPSDPRPPRELFALAEAERTSLYCKSSARLRQKDSKQCAQAGRRARASEQRSSSLPRRDGLQAAPLEPPSRGYPVVARDQRAAEVEGGAGEREPETRSSPSDESTDALQEIEKLGDRGELDLALARVNDFIRDQPRHAAAYLLRGQLFLAAKRVDEAVGDFRSAIFLDGRHRLARYWYATALTQSGMSTQARAQLLELEKQLQQTAGDALVEDNDTSAAELLQEAQELRERIER